MLTWARKDWTGETHQWINTVGQEKTLHPTWMQFDGTSNSHVVYLNLFGAIYLPAINQENQGISNSIVFFDNQKIVVQGFRWSPTGWSRVFGKYTRSQSQLWTLHTDIAGARFFQVNVNCTSKEHQSNQRRRTKIWNCSRTGCCFPGSKAITALCILESLRTKRIRLCNRTGNEDHHGRRATQPDRPESASMRKSNKKTIQGFHKMSWTDQSRCCPWGDIERADGFGRPDRRYRSNHSMVR